MPAKCGPLGPMECLNGATCNVTSGDCVGCPAGYRDDEVLFVGNKNCGVNEAAIIVVYFVSAIFSVVVSVFAASGIKNRRRSRIKASLLIISIWTALVPFYCLAHYLEGFRMGLITTILFLIISMLVNGATFFLQYTIGSFLRLILNNGIKQDVLRGYLLWHGFWELNKVACGIPMIIGAATGDDSLYNSGLLALTVFLFIEIAGNIGSSYLIHRRLISNVRDLHSTMQMNKLSPVVKEFAERVAKTLWIGPFWGLLTLVAGTAIVALYIVFDSSIPYVCVIWALLLLTWPLVGVGPVIMLRTKLGIHIDHGTPSGTTGNNDGTMAVGRETSDARSPKSYHRKKTVVDSSGAKSPLSNQKRVDDEVMDGRVPQHDDPMRKESAIDDAPLLSPAM